MATKFLATVAVVMVAVASLAQDDTELARPRAHVKFLLEHLEMSETIQDTTLYGPIETADRAIEVVEPSLFEIYGRRSIIGQRPYIVNRVDDHWLISGTLPGEVVGGTFKALLRASDGKLIHIMHEE